jgi:hypothetical protein
LKARISDALAAVTEEMLEKTWGEIKYRVDVLLAANGTHTEVYWCRRIILFELR